MATIVFVPCNGVCGYGKKTSTQCVFLCIMYVVELSSNPCVLIEGRRADTADNMLQQQDGMPNTCAKWPALDWLNILTPAASSAVFASLMAVQLQQWIETCVMGDASVQKHVGGGCAYSSLYDRKCLHAYHAYALSCTYHPWAIS